MHVNNMNYASKCPTNLYKNVILCLILCIIIEPFIIWRFNELSPSKSLTCDYNTHLKKSFFTAFQEEINQTEDLSKPLLTATTLNNAVELNMKEFDLTKIEDVNAKDTTDHKTHTEVVMFIPSPMEWKERRRIRNLRFLMDNYSSEQIQMFYVIGDRAGDDLGIQLDLSAIKEEEQSYSMHLNLRYVYTDCRDLGEDFGNPNGTSSTSCKVYRAMKYAYQNYVFKYLWRGSEDAYINFKAFFQKLVFELPPPPFYVGYMRNHMHGNDGDLQLSRQPLLQAYVWKMKEFGSYMTGMGFMVSYDVARFVDALTIQPHQSWCEDVVVGAWFMPFKIRWVDVNSETSLIMGNRDAFHMYNCKSQLLVHYVQESDWFNVDGDGNLMYCY